jgi:chromatin remodeling complex protein RSC6
MKDQETRFKEENERRLKELKAINEENERKEKRAKETKEAEERRAREVTDAERSRRQAEEERANAAAKSRELENQMNWDEDLHLLGVENSEMDIESTAPKRMKKRMDALDIQSIEGGREVYKKTSSLINEDSYNNKGYLEVVKMAVEEKAFKLSKHLLSLQSLLSKGYNNIKQNVTNQPQEEKQHLGVTGMSIQRLNRQVNSVLEGLQEKNELFSKNIKAQLKVATTVCLGVLGPTCIAQKGQDLIGFIENLEKPEIEGMVYLSELRTNISFISELTQHIKDQIARRHCKEF